jgi:hypothetical protein
MGRRTREEQAAWVQEQIKESERVVAVYLALLAAAGNDPRLVDEEIPRRPWSDPLCANLQPGGGWLGIDMRPRIVVPLDDGLFQAMNRYYSDYIALGLGHPDPSGGIYEQVNRIRNKRTGELEGSPCWNAYDQVNSFIHSDPNEKALQFVRDFDMERYHLRSNPKGWPDPYRSAFFETHDPNDWPDDLIIEPKLVRGA